MDTLKNRYDVVYIFDVTNGNPNGDPDAGNLPRIDPETAHGIITDVALKRKIRNYVQTVKGNEAGFEIYAKDGVVLNQQHEKAYTALNLKPSNKLPKDNDQKIVDWMCKNFFDVRAFGAVMTTKVNAGQVRGPIQFTFSRSVEPIMPIEVTITRSSVTNEQDIDKERTMGRKHIVPYGLYIAHAFVNAKLAQERGFSAKDLELVWDSLINMFEFDRSASRSEMSARRLIVFEHENELGNAQAHKLFERVKISRINNEEIYPVGDARTHNWTPTRKFSDYQINVDKDQLESGVTIKELI